MKYRLGINGFGRIGRNVARINALRQNFELVAINDINPDVGNLAYLYKYDSTLGRYPGDVKYSEGELEIDGNKITVFNNADFGGVPWDKCGVDVVIDCSGVSENDIAGRALINSGVINKMVITHMSPNVDRTIIMGVNEQDYDPGTDHVLSSAICDANAIGPVISHLHEVFGISSGFVTTLHPWLSYQKLVDAPLQSQSHPGHFWKDYRLGRASIGALIPKETTAVTAFLKVVPEMEGRLEAISYRVPTHVVSSADMSFYLETDVTLERVMTELESLAEKCPYVHMNRDPLISVDFEQTDASCLVDMQFTRVVGRRMLKIILWYDNEWGYSNRALDVALLSLSS